MMGESCVCLGSKKIGVFGSFRHFEKQSKSTKNSDFFASKKYATLSHHFEPS